MATKPTKKQAREVSGDMPRVVYAQASPRSLGGVSMFDVATIDSGDVAAFMSEEGVIRNAVARLSAAGFEVLQTSATTINIAGPAALYDRVFATSLFTEERPVIKQFGEDVATFVETPDTELPGLIDTSSSHLADVLEGVAIEVPRYFHAPNAFAPMKSYWHLRVPGDVSLGCNADKAHRGGITGKGIKVVMCDSGWEAHPYFVQRGYKFSPTVLGPGTANAGVDANGHGTGESANIFAVAPDVDFTMVKMNFANSIGSFNAAVALAPHIISNSWGSSIQNGPLGAADLAMAAAIAIAVASGIIVVFSAGNGHWGFPGQHPDVISAGGVYMEANGALKASSYSSGFNSNVYPGRKVPDLSGLVGLTPKAMYIMLPIPAGCAIDTGNAGGTHPNGDETTTNDGWAAFSGTSAAAPQLAGAAALVKQACPKLTPAQVRAVLMKTARDVTTGPNAHGNTAAVGFDVATGAGLVDAHKAMLSAKIKCLPIGPGTPSPIVGPAPSPGPSISPGPTVGPKPPNPGPLPPKPPQPPGPTVVNPGPPMGASSGSDQGPGLTDDDVAALESMMMDSPDAFDP